MAADERKMTRTIEPRLAIAIALGALLVAGACSKNNTSADTQTAAGDVASIYSIGVSDVALGHHVDANQRVTVVATEFAPTDSVFASVHSTGNRPIKLTARWTYQNGKVVAERSELVSPHGDAYTEFHIFKPRGWPAGRYTLHVLADGNEVQTKDFTVGK
jgi:hypothetical protein